MLRAKAPILSGCDSAGLRQVVANGLDPRAVGDCVVDAVRRDRFWILPAPEYLRHAEARLEELRSLFPR